MVRFFFLTTALPLFALAAGCKGGSTPPEGEVAAPAAPVQKPVTSISPEAQAEADQIFASRCVPCHGAAGHGDGPASGTLSPKPRNYSDKEWQKSVTDEQIEKTVVYGGSAVGKSPAMPPNPDLADKPQVAAALRQKIRNFAR